MSISAESLKRAVFDLFKFNPKDFSVQSSGVGFNVGVISPPRSSGDGGSTGPISFVYCRDGMSPREIISPLNMTFANLTNSTFDYPDLTTALAGLATRQGNADILASAYAQQSYRQNSWTGINWASTNYPAVTTPGFATAGTLRCWMGLPGIEVPLTSGLQTYYAYKSSTIYGRRSGTADTRCSIACAIRGCNLRLYAFMRQAGVPKRYRIAYTLDQYLELSSTSSGGTGPSSTTTLISRTLTVSTPQTMDISFTERLGMYGFNFPPLDIFSLPWPTVPSLPPAVAGTLQSRNYQTKLALNIVSITALP